MNRTTPHESRENGAAEAVRRPAPVRGAFARLRAVVRALAWLAFATFVLGALAARQVWADARETSLVVGRELAQLGDLMKTTSRLSLNGQTMYVSTAGTDQPLAQVLDRFEAHCAQHATAVAEEFQKLPEALRAKIDAGDKGRGLGVLRHATADEGIVACFANDEAGGSGAVVARMKRFLATHDLGELGKLRYVYATKTAHGTHVVAVWTDGKVALDRMFPATGDADGTDSPIVPRPEGSRRILSAAVDGAAYGLRIYETRTPPEQVWRDLTTQMDARGWAHVAPPESRPAPGSARGFVRGDGVEIAVTMAAKDGTTTVTYVELGRAGAATTEAIDLTP